MTVTLYQGDSAQVLKTFPPASIDLTVTSPPYDNLRTYKGNYQFDFETIAQELYRVTKPGGVVVWVVGDATINGSETGTSFRQALYFKELGFNLHDTMIYAKTDFPPLTHNRYEQQFEYMFVFCSGKLSTFNPLLQKSKHSGELRNKKNNKQDTASAIRGRVGYTTINESKIKTNVWFMSGAHTNIDHPAIFPESLARDHILSWSNPGDTVLDPFLGSGTTLKMAVLYDRNGIGIEIEPEYMAIAERRIKDAQQQMRLPLDVE